MENDSTDTPKAPDIHSMDCLTTLSIELASKCNIRCKMCSHPSNPRKTEVMSFDQFKSIIDKLQNTKIKRLLFNMGEPFMNKQIFMMVSYAKRRDFFVYISTNGLLLTESLMNNIFKTGVDALKFSIEGYTPEMYRQIRCGGDFDRLLQNVSRLKELRDQFKSSLYIWISTIIMKGNENIVEFAKFWGPYCDDLEFCGLSNHIGLIDNTPVSLSPTWTQRKSCPQIKPFQEIDVLSNGDVVICCVDFHGRCVLGNLFNQDFEEIWNSEKMSRIREKADSDQTFDIDPCRDCYLADYSTVFGKNLRGEINLIHQWIKEKEWDALKSITWAEGSGASCVSCNKPLKISFAGLCLDCLKAGVNRKQKA